MSLRSKLQKWLKTQWREFLVSLKKHIHAYILTALVLWGGIAFSWLKNLLTSILTIPIAHWKIGEFLFVLTAILILVSFVYFLIDRALKFFNSKDEIPIQTQKEVLPSGFTRPTPQEIYNEIEKQPRLLQKEFANNYIGINVTWSGTYYDIYDEGNDEISVGISTDFGSFLFTTHLKDYPIFRTLKEGAAKIKVTGTISQAYASIMLGDAKIISLEVMDKNDQSEN